MDSIDALRNQVGYKLTKRVAQALSDQEITRDELSQISKDILDNIYDATTKEELFKFLDDLAARWPFLSDTVSEEKNNTRGVSQNKDQQAQVSHIDTLINENKIDDALAAARKATTGETQAAEPGQVQTQDQNQGQEGVN